MRSWFVVLVVLLGWGAVRPPGAVGLPACMNGRFVVQGAPLVGGGPANIDAVVVADEKVAIASGCDAIPARVKTVSVGARLRARWKSCAGLVGPVRLTATIFGTACGGMSGVLKAPRARVRRRFAARHEFETPRSCADDTTFGTIQTRIFAARG